MVPKNKKIFFNKIEKYKKNKHSFKVILTKMSFFEEDEELKREIDEEVQRLRLEERKKYINSRALAILAEEKMEKNKEMLKQVSEDDFYVQFIEDTIIKTHNKENTLTSLDIYPSFNSWFKNNYPTRQKISLSTMNIDLQMSHRLGSKQSGKRYWTGYRLKL
jgi:hypothetical protein